MVIVVRNMSFQMTFIIFSDIIVNDFIHSTSFPGDIEIAVLVNPW